jgi:NAD(P)-dependent dehydrogenase (short-subunit alcohol dehydrogenase family)
MIKLDGQVALVVGAGHGAGRLIARHLSAAGAQVALNDQLPGPIEQLAEELGAAARPFPGDSAKKLSAQGLVQDVVEAYGRIDLFVFANAVQPRDPILDMDEWDWRHGLDLNLTGAFLMTQTVGRVMRALGGGRILMVVDHPSDDGAPTSAAYRTAAAALRGLAQAAEEEFRAYNIHVHTLAAGGLPAALDAALQGEAHAQE